jgi:hypothetical protein
MDVDRILAELRVERDLLDQAIARLESLLRLRDSSSQSPAGEAKRMAAEAGSNSPEGS